MAFSWWVAKEAARRYQAHWEPEMVERCPRETDTSERRISSEKWASRGVRGDHWKNDRDTSHGTDSHARRRLRLPRGGESAGITPYDLPEAYAFIERTLVRFTCRIGLSVAGGGMLRRFFAGGDPVFCGPAEPSQVAGQRHMGGIRDWD